MESEVARAIRAIAKYAKEHSWVYVGGTTVPPAREVLQRQQEIDAIALELDRLADRADSAGYREFEELLRRLHRASSSPPNEMVSQVACAFIER